ncbi:MAG: NUDIX domain-containing protein [Patescibacteria group bacterium]
MDPLTPKVVICVMVQKDGKTLLNFRKGSFAANMFGMAGGKLENMETFQQAADRECLEEAGITIGPLRFVCIMNNHLHNPHHFVNLGVVADWVSGEPQVLEPEKCASWGWYDLDDLPQPLTEVTTCLMKAYKTGQSYFDEPAQL